MADHEAPTPAPTNVVKAYAKGIIATAIAFAGALGVALTDGVITPVEWTVIAVATLTAAGTVIGVPNTYQNRL